MTGAIADGYAALTLAPPGREVVPVEYKVNFLAPARGEKLVARGEVVSAGRRLFVCKAEVVALENGEELVCANLLQTLSRRSGPDLALRKAGACCGLIRAFSVSGACPNADTPRDAFGGRSPGESQR